MRSISFKIRVIMLLIVIVFVAGIGVQNASAAVAVVGSCTAGVHFSTIQGAIDASPAGTTIRICPGTYPEQISINKNLTLLGVPSGTADAIIITPPASGLTSNTTSLFSTSPIAAHLLVDTATDVNLKNLIVDSASNNINACAPELIGIFYRNASGILDHVVTRNQFIGTSEGDTNYNGCQTGLGVFAQSGSNGISTVTVQNSSAHDYQKNGITGNEVGTTITVLNNDVVGQGATNGAAENGVQIGFGAGGTVFNNRVIDDVRVLVTASDSSGAASGILLFDAASGVLVKANTVGNTQYGIALESVTPNADDGEQVIRNHIVATRIFDGIDVCSNGNFLKNNSVVNSAESAIHLDAGCGSTGNNNTVQNNVLSDGNVGILKDGGTTGNTITSNTFFTMKTTDPGGARDQSQIKPARP